MNRKASRGSLVNNMLSVLDRAQRDDVGGFYLNVILCEHSTALHPVPRLYTGIRGFGTDIPADVKAALKSEFTDEIPLGMMGHSAFARGSVCKTTVRRCMGSVELDAVRAVLQLRAVHCRNNGWQDSMPLLMKYHPDALASESYLQFEKGLSNSFVLDDDLPREETVKLATPKRLLQAIANGFVKYRSKAGTEAQSRGDLKQLCASVLSSMVSCSLVPPRNRSTQSSVLHIASLQSSGRMSSR